MSYADDCAGFKGFIKWIISSKWKYIKCSCCFENNKKDRELKFSSLYYDGPIYSLHLWYWIISLHE